MYRRKSVGKVNCRETETQGGSRVYRGEAVELESQLPGPGMVETQTDDGGEGQHEEQIEGASDWFLACMRGDWGPGSVDNLVSSQVPSINLSRQTKHVLIELERGLPLPCHL